MKKVAYILIAIPCAVLTIVCAPFVWLDEFMTDKVLYGLRLKWWVKRENKQ